MSSTRGKLTARARRRIADTDARSGAVIAFRTARAQRDAADVVMTTALRQLAALPSESAESIAEALGVPAETVRAALDPSTEPP